MTVPGAAASVKRWWRWVHAFRISQLPEGGISLCRFSTVCLPPWACTELVCSNTKNKSGYMLCAMALCHSGGVAVERTPPTVLVFPFTKETTGSILGFISDEEHAVWKLPGLVDLGQLIISFIQLRASEWKTDTNSITQMQLSGSSFLQFRVERTLHALTQVAYPAIVASACLMDLRYWTGQVVLCNDIHRHACRFALHDEDLRNTYLILIDERIRKLLAWCPSNVLSQPCVAACSSHCFTCAQQTYEAKCST